ncbi:MAG: hypothetical protein KF861_00605 [Planctomycetaceae bacterium]|nr:hypothetical protein [Planctomycetaceae bacterium]
MTQITIDESTAQTPIGDLLRYQPNDVIELRSESGELLGTLILSDRADDERYQTLERQADADQDLIHERLARPAAQGLSTSEFLDRLKSLGREA